VSRGSPRTTSYGSTPNAIFCGMVPPRSGRADCAREGVLTARRS
jgi:hypothetical protein